MTRFFVRPEQIQDGVVELDADDALHLDRVLRAKVGDPIGILDGTGKRYDAEIISLTKSRAIATIIAKNDADTEPSVRIVVAQAYPKTAEKLEWALQHGVEIGASGFWIFRGKRSEAGRLAEKPERWAKIVKTAAEQSGRSLLPEAGTVQNIAEVVQRRGEFDLALLCDESESAQTLQSVLSNRKPASILIIIGPEGGWAQEERQLCLDNGITPITLGKRVLRTETAALVALSQILFALDAG